MKAGIQNIGCVVMASGLSARYGKNKLLEDLGGRPVILHTVESQTEPFWLGSDIAVETALGQRKQRQHLLRMLEETDAPELVGSDRLNRCCHGQTAVFNGIDGMGSEACAQQVAHHLGTLCNKEPHALPILFLLQLPDDFYLGIDNHFRKKL